jgi:hypothetical protein
LAITLSWGEAKKDDSSVITNTVSLESPKVLLQRALLEHFHPELAAVASSRLRGSRQLEDNEEKDNQDQEEQQQEEEGQEEADQDNSNNDDGQNQNDDGNQDDETDDEGLQENMTLVERFNTMSRSSKIWTLVLVVWGFIILFACLIMCVRGCTEQRKETYRSKKQPLMTSSVGTQNSDDSNGRGRRKGWFARMGERNRERLERRSRSRSRGRGRSRSRSRGRN